MNIRQISWTGMSPGNLMGLLAEHLGTDSIEELIAILEEDPNRVLLCPWMGPKRLKSLLYHLTRVHGYAIEYSIGPAVKVVAKRRMYLVVYSWGSGTAHFVVRALPGSLRDRGAILKFLETQRVNVAFGDNVWATEIDIVDYLEAGNPSRG